MVKHLGLQKPKAITRDSLMGKPRVTPTAMRSQMEIRDFAKEKHLANPKAKCLEKPKDLRLPKG